MATIKRGRPKKEKEPLEAEKIETPVEQPKEPPKEAPKEEAKPIHQPVQETKPVEPVIRILQPRAMPKIIEPKNNRLASGNVYVCDNKTGKCVSMSASYATNFIKRNKNYYIKK